MSRCLKNVAPIMIGVALVCAMPLHPLCHESPVDHVDRGVRIWIDGESILVSYQLQISERAAMMQLHAMDANRDGAISDEERNAYFERFRLSLNGQLDLELGGKKATLAPVGNVRLLPQFRQVYTFSATIGKLERGTTPGRFVDNYSRSYPGDYRWAGPKVDTAKGPRVVVKAEPSMVDAAGTHGMLVINYDVIVP